MGNDADNDDTAADIDAMTKTTRRHDHDNQPEKRHERPWHNKVAVAVAVDVECG